LVKGKPIVRSFSGEAKDRLSLGESKRRKAGYRVSYGSAIGICDGNLGAGSEHCKVVGL
jgi:hypothetical protein